MLKNQGKKVFTLIAVDAGKRAAIEERIKKHVEDCVIYSAGEYPEGLQKVKNVPPHVVLTEHDLPKGKPGQIVESILADEDLKFTAIIILSPLPQRERYLDELVTGRVQFLEDTKQETDFGPTLSKALNLATQAQPADFRLRFLQPGDVLIKEGDRGGEVYIVKKGTLRAVQNKTGTRVELGNIEAGEFVGEMAYFNGEPRMATVEAVTECELVEIPNGTFEKILFQRPAWSKTLLQTLSKRLKRTTA